MRNFYAFLRVLLGYFAMFIDARLAKERAERDRQRLEQQM
jgi:hypothetical protein